jgi:hypothetical protein
MNYKDVHDLARHIAWSCTVDEQQFDSSHRAEIREDVLRLAKMFGILPGCFEEQRALERLHAIRESLNQALAIGEKP